MAKTSMINRENKRTKLVTKYAAKRAELKAQIRDLKHERRGSPDGASPSCNSCRAIRARRVSAIAAH